MYPVVQQYYFNSQGGAGGMEDLQLKTANLTQT